MRKINKILIFGAIFITASGIFFGGYYYLNINKKAAVSMDQVRDARNTYSSGDYNSSIQEAQLLLDKTSDKAQRGVLQLTLASGLISRNQGTDLQEGVVLLQKITNDYSVSPVVRALAYSNLASIIIGENIEFYKKNVSTPPFDSYLPTLGSDSNRIYEAYAKLLKLSDETYPNSAAEYELAGGYYWRSVVNNLLTGEDLRNAALAMQNYVKEGDERKDQSLYSPGGVMYGLFYRARALSTSATILKNNTLPEQEDAYKLVLSTAEKYRAEGQNTGNPVFHSAILKTRFYYSDFLLQNYGNERGDDIRNLLKPFELETSPNPLLGSLGNLKNTANTNFIKIEALKLAKISPEFKKFLLVTGLKL